jgi:hypothetical protein
MYLPQEIRKAHILITVKTYPVPPSKYGEPVFTAGLLDGKKWLRIYPIPYKLLTNDINYPKYSFIELDLIRNTKDFRPESYRPRRGIDEDIKVINKLGTAKGWATRRNLVSKEIFTSMQELIALAKGKEKKSLATLKPLELIDFVIEDEERHGKEKRQARRKQANFFEVIETECPDKDPYPVRKLPYKYSYRFLTEGDARPRKLKIADWELGAFFWNCLNKTDGDEQEANRLVRQKYLDEFRGKKDLYLFVGTNKLFHTVSPNPFMIIGVFYPPNTMQTSLF